MSREQDDRNSIWASRTSPDSFASTFGFSAPQRRARAGTSPSRLPSRSPPRIDTSGYAAPFNQKDKGTPLTQLGSLALISPGGSDIVYDSFPPSSRSAVGQQPGETRRSPPLESIPEPASESHNNDASRPTNGGANGEQHFNGSSGGPSSHHPNGPNGPNGGTSSTSPTPSTSSSSHNHQNHQNGHQSSLQNGSQIQPPASSSLDSSLAPGVSTRSRAGSMNSVGSRTYPFNPFGNSIWGPGTMTPLASSSTGSSAGSSGTPASSISGVSSAGMGAGGFSDVDASSPFGGDPFHAGGSRSAGLANPSSGAPSRMRSYTTMDAPTLSGGSSLGSASLNGLGAGGPSLTGGNSERPHSHARNRAHTSLGATGVSSAPLMSLGRMTHPYNLETDALPLGGDAVSGGMNGGMSGGMNGGMSGGLNGGMSGGLGSGGVQLGDFSSVPTPASFISNVPPHMSTAASQGIFGNFGRIESAGVIPACRSAYIVFASTIQAIEAQATANGAESYSGNGPSSVSFAQVSSSSPAISGAGGSGHAVGSSRTSPSRSSRSSPPRDGEAAPTAMLAGAKNSTMGTTLPPGAATAPASGLSSTSGLSGASMSAMSAMSASEDASSASPISVAYVSQSSNAPSAEVQAGVAHLKRAAAKKFDVPISPLSEALAGEERVYNAAVSRDSRRKIESMHQRDIEELALDMQHESPSLASDYIGNTVVQSIFERASADMRDMMSRRLVPVFAATGTHKNGTWAVQKMIDLARGPRQYASIEQAIRPHLVSSSLDQFGNYVVQACSKFGAPYNDFVYAGVASSLAKVAPNRFGARAVRASLESEHTTLANQRLVATAIVQQITSLALNANGCSLVSWSLDGFERVDPSVHAKTHTLVANQLVPRYLATSCSSKIGSGIVIKLASSSSSTSSQRVFDSLLEPLTDDVPPILVEVLEDVSGQGPATVYKSSSSVFPSNSLERQVTVNKVRSCSLRPGAVIPNHKRLLEECGLEMLINNAQASTGSANDSNGSANGTTTSPASSNGSMNAAGMAPLVASASSMTVPTSSTSTPSTAATAPALTSSVPLSAATAVDSTTPNAATSSTSPKGAEFTSTTSSSTSSSNTLGSDHAHPAHAHGPHSHQRQQPPRSTPSPTPNSTGSSNPSMMHTGVPSRYTH